MIDISSNAIKYSFHNVWSEKNQDLLDEIVDAWKQIGAIPPGQSGMDRAKQVVYLVRDENGKIVAITTAFITYFPQLKHDVFAFRALIFKENRIPGLLPKLTKMTLEYLESIHHSIDKNIIGVITEVENQSLQKLNRVVLSTGFTFIGYSKRGNPVRVYYFKGAKLS